MYTNTGRFILPEVNKCSIQLLEQGDKPTASIFTYNYDMKVFIISAFPFVERINIAPQYLKESFELDTHKKHQLADDPDEADVILFAEHHPADDPYFFKILKSPVYKRYKQKCYLYHDSDFSITLLPTICPSVKKSNYNPLFEHPSGYVVQIETNPYLRENDVTVEKKYLYSFMGAVRNNPARKRLFDIDYKDAYMLDTTSKNSWELSGEEREEYSRNYARVSSESKFILCPGGIGPNSYRLYECLKMGIPPVIISDEWVPTPGPDWNTFSITIAEKDILAIPRILEEKEPECEAMGKKAREIWLQYFAKPNQFHYLMEAVQTLHTNRPGLGISTCVEQLGRFVTSFHLRNLLRYYKKRISKK